MLRCGAFVRTDVSKKRIASIITVTRIGELVTTLSLTSNQSMLHIVFVHIVLRLLVSVNVPGWPIIVTLMMEAICTPKRRCLQQPYGITSHKTVFFNWEIIDIGLHYILLRTNTTLIRNIDCFVNKLLLFNYTSFIVARCLHKYNNKLEIIFSRLKEHLKTELRHYKLWDWYQGQAYEN
jgi:hypothetical protein